MTATSAVLPASTNAAAAPRRLAAPLWVGALLIVLAFLVIYPLLMLIFGALSDSNPVVDGFGNFKPSVKHFVDVLGNENVHLAFFNALAACGGGTILAVVIGLSPKTGLLNTSLKWLGIDFRFNFYSMSGLIVVFGIYYAPYVYMFTASALKNMDPSLEEASEVAGASAFTTLFTVTFPLIAPAILAGSLLSFVVMLGIYGVPAALGAPADINVLTTYIFKLTAWSPPLYNTTAAVAILLMVVTAILVWAQQRVLSGKSFATVAGKAFRPRALNLGPWRWFTLGLAIAYLLIVVVLPTLALVIAAFRKFMFFKDFDALFDMKQYSWVHFNAVFDNPLTMLSIWNTLKVGVITALAGGALAFAIGYTVNRTRVGGRGSIDLLATLPVAIPGLVIGVAYLWAWIGLPGGLYGTIWILALAFVARFMPDTVKALSTSFLQIHKELEEAAWISGRGMLSTIRTIVLPLARPGVVASMTLLFVLAIRELGSSLFLYTSDTTVMAVLLLDYYEGGNTGKTAAFSLVQTAILAVLLSITTWLSRETTQSARFN